jgi:hypothetical protein
VHLGRANADALAFAEKSASFEESRAVVRRVEEARWALEVHRSAHPAASTVDFARRLVPTLDRP